MILSIQKISPIQIWDLIILYNMLFPSAIIRHNHIVWFKPMVENAISIS